MKYYDFAENHGFLAALFWSDPSQFLPLRNRGYSTKPEAKKFLTHAVLHLDEQLKNLNTPYFLISGEAFAKTSQRSTNRFREFLEKRFSDIEVVSYVRPPASMVSSFMQQAIKGGATYDDVDKNDLSIQIKHANDQREGKIVPCYEEKLTHYLNSYGQKKVAILNFSSNSLIHKNVVYDFFERVFGICKDDIHLEAKRQNERLSNGSVRFLEQYNRVRPLYKDGNMRPKRKYQLRYLLNTLSSMPGRRYRLPENSFNSVALDRHIESDVQWLSEVTSGEINYGKINCVPDEEDSKDDFLFSLICKLLDDKLLIDAQAEFFRALVQLPYAPDRAKKVIANNLCVIDDLKFLLNAAHLLRREQSYELSIVALDRCIEEARIQNNDPIREKALRSRASALQKIINQPLTA